LQKYRSAVDAMKQILNFYEVSFQSLIFQTSTKFPINKIGIAAVT